MKKKKLISLVKMDVRRCILSWKFLIIICGVFMVCLLSMTEQLQMAIVPGNQREDWSSAEQLMALLTFDRFKTLLVVILAALYSGSYCEDWNHRYFRFILSRSNLKNYACSRVLITVVGVVLATVLGFLLLILVLLPWMQVGKMENTDWFGVYQGVVSGSAPLIVVLILGWNFGLSAAFLAVIGLWMSVKQPEGFVAIGGPFFVFYFIYAISLILPDSISFNKISSQAANWMGNPWLSFGYSTVFLSVLILAAGVGFYCSLRKRWKNGLL